MEKVPEERLKSPDPEIAVPLLQSLTYTAQNETLREMYIALLANSMDNTLREMVAYNWNAHDMWIQTADPNTLQGWTYYTNNSDNN